MERSPLATDWQTPAAQHRRGPFAAACIIACAAMLSYCNSFSGTFLFDDEAWIVRRDAAASTSSLHLDMDSLVGSRPLIGLTLDANYAICGMHVWGYHAVNLAIHILAAWTLFGILRRTFLLPTLCNRFGSFATPLALSIALLWAVHPLQTQAVTYIIQRCESLMGLLYLLTLYCVLRGAASNRSFPWNCAAVAACVLGMATKEVMATAPVVVLLYDRALLGGSFRNAWRARHWLYVALAASWAIVAWPMATAGSYGGTTGFAVQKFTWWTYLLTQSEVLPHYLRLAFWPVGLCFDYAWPPATTLSETLPSSLLIAGLLVLTAWALIRRPAIGFLGAWFFLILAPSSSIVPIADAAYEHRMYLSLAAVIATVVIGAYCAGQWAVGRKMFSMRAARIAGVGSVAAVAAVLTCLTLHRNTVYGTAISLWQDTIAKSPENARAYSNLGKAMFEKGRIDEAVDQYRKSLAIFSDSPIVHYNLGTALCRQNRLDEGMRHYEAALKLKPTYAEAHNNYGMALASQGRMDEAMGHYRIAIENKPQYRLAHNNLGNALARCGRIEEAIDEFEKAIEAYPAYADAHNNLGSALVRQGQLDRAISHYRKAVEINPDFEMAHANLGAILASQGDFKEAIGEFQHVLRLNPNNSQVRQNLERAIAQQESGRSRLLGQNNATDAGSKPNKDATPKAPLP